MRMVFLSKPSLGHQEPELEEIRRLKKGAAAQETGRSSAAPFRPSTRPPVWNRSMNTFHKTRVEEYGQNT